MCRQRFGVHVVAIRPVAGFVVLAHRVQIEALVPKLARREGLAVGARVQELTRIALPAQREVLAPFLNYSFTLREAIRGYRHRTEHWKDRIQGKC